MCFCVWGKNVIRAACGSALIKPGACLNKLKRPRTCPLRWRQEPDTVGRCSLHRLVFHLRGGEQIHHCRKNVEHPRATAVKASRADLLTVKVSLILKLQSTWSMSLAWRKPFPRTTTWNVSGYKTQKRFCIYLFFKLKITRGSLPVKGLSIHNHIKTESVLRNAAQVEIL